MIILGRRDQVEMLVLDDGRRLLVGDWGFEGFAIRLEGELNSLKPAAGGLAAGGACAVGRVLEACLAARIDCSPFADLQGQIGAALLRADNDQRDRMSGLVDGVEFVDWRGRKHTVTTLQDLPAQVAAITRVMLRGPAILNADDIADRIEARRLLLQSRTPRYQHLGAALRLADGSSAASVVRQVGLAGLSMGQVGIPKASPDTIVNLGGATAREVLDLVDCVAARLYGRLQVMLEPDLRIVGSL
jgi:UDP-N-acetylmuramate dehydrogenase